MKLRQGNGFTPVCHSVHWGGGCLPQCMLGYTPPGRHPLADIHPRANTPWVDTPPADNPPRRSLQPTVRILLECILVCVCACLYLLRFLNHGHNIGTGWCCSRLPLGPVWERRNLQRRQRWHPVRMPARLFWRKVWVHLSERVFFLWLIFRT